MGWTTHPGMKLRDVISELKRPGRNERILATKIIRTTPSRWRMWMVMQTDIVGLNRISIIEYLFEYRGGEWTSKAIYCCDGPLDYDCPKSYLDRLIRSHPHGSEFCDQWITKTQQCHQAREESIHGKATA